MSLLPTATCGHGKCTNDVIQTWGVNRGSLIWQLCDLGKLINLSDPHVPVAGDHDDNLPV